MLFRSSASTTPGLFAELALTKNELENIFDSPFTKDNNGVRIIKSHIFSEHIPFLHEMFPEVPIVMVRRSDDSCLGWWVKCGHFDITYPLYHEYYQNLRHMAGIIKQQNKNLLDAWWKYTGKIVTDNLQLASALNIETNEIEMKNKHDIFDKVIKYALNHCDMLKDYITDKTKRSIFADRILDLEKNLPGLVSASVIHPSLKSKPAFLHSKEHLKRFYEYLLDHIEGNITGLLHLQIQNNILAPLEQGDYEQASKYFCALFEVKENQFDEFCKQYSDSAVISISMNM